MPFDVPLNRRSEQARAAVAESPLTEYRNGFVPPRKSSEEPVEVWTSNNQLDEIPMCTSAETRTLARWNPKTRALAAMVWRTLMLEILG